MLDWASVVFIGVHWNFESNVFHVTVKALTFYKLDGCRNIGANYVVQPSGRFLNHTRSSDSVHSVIEGAMTLGFDFDLFTGVSDA